MPRGMTGEEQKGGQVEQSDNEITALSFGLVSSTSKHQTPHLQLSAFTPQLYLFHSPISKPSYLIPQLSILIPQRSPQTLNPEP